MTYQKQQMIASYSKSVMRYSRIAIAMWILIICLVIIRVFYSACYSDNAINLTDRIYGACILILLLALGFLLYFSVPIAIDRLTKKANDFDDMFRLSLNKNIKDIVEPHNKTQQTEPEGASTTDKNEPSQDNDEIAPKEPEK